MRQRLKLVRAVGFEPTASAFRVRHSTQTELRPEQGYGAGRGVGAVNMGSPIRQPMDNVKHRSFRTPRLKDIPAIDNWEVGTLFGVAVLLGTVDNPTAAQRVVVRVLWWANGVFGISRSGATTDGFLAAGEPK